MTALASFRQLRGSLSAANTCMTAGGPDAAHHAIRHLRLAVLAAATLEKHKVMERLEARLKISEPGPFGDVPAYRLEARTAIAELGDPDVAPQLIVGRMTRIICLTAAVFDYDADTLRNKDRRPGVVEARNMAMLLLAALTQASLNEIGAALGGRNHKTILHGIRNAADWIDESDYAAFRAMEVMERLPGNAKPGEAQ
ncbi:helix-turn-helix domain-containing protein [Ruegeria atlantica]|uniref:helix-turn-helix domain-containing protein n=1 Tax=Ruegeria atlantica TaxID=81569 RepID=UPI00147AF78B|nr:helix-turn-helix domain-containing protein [Ruegeria atlantica]